MVARESGWLLVFWVVVRVFQVFVSMFWVIAKVFGGC